MTALDLSTKHVSNIKDKSRLSLDSSSSQYRDKLSLTNFSFNLNLDLLCLMPDFHQQLSYLFDNTLSLITNCAQKNKVKNAVGNIQR